MEEDIINIGTTSYKLPEGWALAQIGDVIGAAGIFVDGDWIESKDQNSRGGVRLIQLADIGDGTFRNRSNRFMTSERAIGLNCTFLEHGDVLVARMPEPLGRAVIFPYLEKNKYVTVVDVAIIRTTKGIYNKYLMNCINSPGIRKQINALETGTTRKRISRSNLSKVVIPVPPIMEQYAIVEIIESLFSELQEAEHSLKKATKLLSVYEYRILKNAFEGGLTESLETLNSSSKTTTNGRSLNSNNGLYALPQKWKWLKIKDIAEVIMGQSPPGASYNTNGIGTPLINGPAEFGPSPFSHTTLTKWTTEPTKFCTEGDLIICVRGSTTGRQNIAGFAACIGRGVAAIRAINVDQQYLNHYFNYSRNRIFKMGTGSTFPNVSQEQLSNFPIPICSLEEQIQIVNEIEYRVTIIDNMEKTIEKSQKRIEYYRQSILKDAFEGKLVHQNVDDEPASEFLNRIKKAEKEYLNRLNKMLKLKPKNEPTMKEKLLIMEILKVSKKPVPTSEVWQQSIYSDDIDGFYAALKKHFDAQEIAEVTRKGKESFLTIIASK